ncbi:MAG: tRNA glutamyl-Q(34) synthetase GluQRS [Acidimicrobiales bacterium]|nr:tRNA glutamyl-Q(34) synthetase GluQRS [Acidimicrobiales bacterium]
MAIGRFAPSPTGDLHLGNLRTAVLAWLFARSAGSAFLMRMEDLDRDAVRPEYYRRQLEDLAALGLDWDGPVVRQSDRHQRYDDAIDQLERQGAVYPCYCSRREIREAASAPHHGAMPDGAYPGTCRELTAAERAEREAAGRPGALRLRVDSAPGHALTITVHDRLAGPTECHVDDIVLRRGNGTPAYNLAVVVDDAAQGVQEVVRGDDLLSSTGRHLYLADRLGLPRPSHAHVPLVLNPEGVRLAKRDGAVTLTDRRDRGESPANVLSWLAHSLELCEADEPVTARDLIDRFDPARLPRRPWTLRAADLAPSRAVLD